jgi:hypothetical protein
MSKTTGLITYNAGQRHRRHRGVERNFDTASLAALINSPEVQEQVKNRDMWGYHGHWPRMAFGMQPGEGGVLDGKVVALEPAFVTTRLEADPDGTVRHEAEFLDTVPGKVAARVFAARAGGFSSAIACRPGTVKDVPVGFYGFDFVSEPNFTKNRGYALDSAAAAAAAEETPDLYIPRGDDGKDIVDTIMMDAAAQESTATLKILDGMLRDLQADHERSLQSLNRVLAENRDLVAMLARLPSDTQQQVKRNMAAMDSVTGRRQAGKSTIEDTAAMFDSAKLEDAEDAGAAAAQRVESTQVLDMVDDMVTLVARRGGF